MDDTIWADKVQVWLTPEQIRVMTEIIQKGIEAEEWRKRWNEAFGEAPTKKLKE